MNLVELSPHLIRYVRGTNYPYESVESFDAAQGIRFRCPQCLKGGERHTIMVWFASRGAPDDAQPLERFGMNGNGLADLTLRSKLLEQCGWHGFVAHGFVGTVKS